MLSDSTFCIVEGELTFVFSKLEKVNREINEELLFHYRQFKTLELVNKLTNLMLIRISLVNMHKFTIIDLSIALVLFNVSVS